MEPLHHKVCIKNPDGTELRYYRPESIIYIKSTVERVHTTKPLDAYENVFRCSCGEVFRSTGYAYCPKMER